MEMRPGKGAQLIRSAGTTARLVAKEGKYATLRLSSGEMRKILLTCRALQVNKIFLISPELSLNVAYFPSLATNLAVVPADLINCAPFPGLISTQCTSVPCGISLSGKQLPDLIGALSPDITFDFSFRSLGAMM